jgi:hypothetical protein
MRLSPRATEESPRLSLGNKTKVWTALLIRCVFDRKKGKIATCIQFFHCETNINISYDVSFSVFFSFFFLFSLLTWLHCSFMHPSYPFMIKLASFVSFNFLFLSCRIAHETKERPCTYRLNEYSEKKTTFYIKDTLIIYSLCGSTEAQLYLLMQIKGWITWDSNVTIVDASI